ncbi:MAG: protein kinase [Cyanobacteria bacterium P01_A01_bin.114]
MNPGAKSNTSPLGARYQIIRELGQGGFGLTYLAEDLQRSQELAVLKEFMPQVDHPAMVTKAKQLFEREAGVLYQLQHPQIPRFRELLRVPTVEGRERLFLVQDYVEGPTYRDLLSTRQRSGGHFTETEIIQLLYQLLPMLDYLHSVGVVHRDISPENLILRNADGLPVLIDFGSVKQVAAKVQQQLQAGDPTVAPTRIGKAGYAPPEQIQTGATDPSSDLYSLAATALVLATGREPAELYDAYHGVWNWSREIALGPELSQILDRMLSFSPRDRFASATAVLGALRGGPAAPANPTRHSFEPAPGGVTAQPSDSLGLGPPELELSDRFSDAGAPALANGEFSPEPPSPAFPEASRPQSADAADPAFTAALTTDTTQNDETDGETGGETDDIPEEGAPLVVSAVVESDSPEPLSFDPLPGNRSAAPMDGPWQALLGLLILLGLVGLPVLLFLSRPGGGLTGIGGGRDRTEISDDSPPVSPTSNGEPARKAQIQSRRADLEIDQAYFNRLVNQIFYRQYPNLRDRPLTSSAEDAPLRLRWDNIAIDTLDLLENNLSLRARRSLGSYGPGNRDAWRNSVNRLNVSSRALYDLSDARFVQLFPNLSPDQSLPQPIGQIWYGLSDDRVRDLESGEALEAVRFEPGAYSQQLSGQLSPGDGQVITLDLTEGQFLRLNLQATPGSTLLSLYLPNPDEATPFLLSDSAETTWSGQLNQSGIYEVVLASRANESIAYQLNVAVDNVTTTPAPEADSPAPEADEAPDSSTQPPDDIPDRDSEPASEADTAAGEDSLGEDSQ